MIIQFANKMARLMVPFTCCNAALWGGQGGELTEYALSRVLTLPQKVQQASVNLSTHSGVYFLSHKGDLKVQ